jgi:CDP-glucose 4,6-dehydratase
MLSTYYHGKTVLVTGHTGFKGSWLSLWLAELGAHVHGLSSGPMPEPTLHEMIDPGIFASERTCDTRDYEALKSAIVEIQPEIIFHLAAQALVLQSYEDPLETFGSNATGTANLLEAVRSTDTRCITLVVTSDKCYENMEWEFAYRETDALGGHDVYSMSKAATELVAASWNRSFFADNADLGPVVTARAGNVIGGGDYAAHRVVPDCIRALIDGKPIEIRKPSAVRPWQHVLECLSGYLCLVESLARMGKNSAVDSPFNFGPDPDAVRPVSSLVEEILASWPGEWIDRSDPEAVHEANLLTLSTDKARHLLGWAPVWGFEQAIRATVEWYRYRHANPDGEPDMEAFSRAQLRQYMADAAERGLPWAVSTADEASLANAT